MHQIKRNQLLLALLLCLAFLANCGGQASLPSSQPETKDSAKILALKTLQTDKEVYDSTFKALAALDQKGKLPPLAKAKLINLGNQYLKLHNLAVQILLDNGTPSMEGVRAALDAFLTLAANYLQ